MESNNNYRGKILHCDELIECETDIEGYKHEFSMDVLSFKTMFFQDLGLEYILNYFLTNEKHFHIAVHSEPTNTCEEKSSMINFELERIIKGFYLEDYLNEGIYALSIPGNKSYDKSKIAEFLDIKTEINGRIRKTKSILPVNIKHGTCHPFVNEDAFKNLGLKYILFDRFYLEKSNDNLHDFSFTTPDYSGYNNHKLSIQMSYKDAFKILKSNSEKIK